MMLSSEPQWRISKIKGKLSDIQSEIQTGTAVNTTTKESGEGAHAMRTGLKRGGNLQCNEIVWRSGNAAQSKRFGSDMV